MHLKHDVHLMSTDVCLPLPLLVWVPTIYLYDHGTGWISAPMVQLPLDNVKLLNIKVELRLHEAFTLLECKQVLHSIVCPSWIIPFTSKVLST